MAAKEYTTFDLDGRELRLSSPSKVYFPAHDGRPPITKLDLAEYYLSVADETVNHLRERPTTLKRFKDGITGDFFFQKRVPEKRPEWMQTATVSFPSGRSATELVPNDAAHLIWAVNLGNIDWNPWPVRRSDLERRMPDRATSRWGKEERHGVFLDYNQNARDRTVASAYSVRPVPDARVSTPLRWDEVADVEPTGLRLDTVPGRVAELGDASADMDANAGRLDGLLDLARRDEEGGLGEAPWPPNFAKQPGEPRRVEPSRRKQDT
jgi:DNA primase